jgi:hypothetical protein
VHTDYSDTGNKEKQSSISLDKDDEEKLPKYIIWQDISEQNLI